MALMTREHVLLCFKTLGDDARFKIMELLNVREYTVRALAEALELTEPTVSHHLGKMRMVGLVTLRMEGNQHFYRLHSVNLERFKQTISRIETLIPTEPEVNDQTWIDALPFDDAEKKTLRDYTFAGRLKRIPKLNKLTPVLKWLTLQFELNTIYTEKEVNGIIERFHPDFASLRRELVDMGYLRREKAGSKYWRTPEDESAGMTPPSTT